MPRYIIVKYIIWVANSLASDAATVRPIPYIPLRTDGSYYRPSQSDDRGAPPPRVAFRPRLSDEILWRFFKFHRLPPLPMVDASLGQHSTFAVSNKCISIIHNENSRAQPDYGPSNVECQQRVSLSEAGDRLSFFSRCRATTTTGGEIRGCQERHCCLSNQATEVGYRCYCAPG
jgi:hypothetical protein